MINVVPSSEQKEYSLAVPIYDIRDYNMEQPAGIYTFGGFIGELIITLSSLHEHLTAKGENPGFEMKSDSIMKFLEELLLDGYPQGICNLKVQAEPLNEAELDSETVQHQAELAQERLLDGKKVTQYGMKFLLGATKKANLNQDIVSETLLALCLINYHKP